MRYVSAEGGRFQFNFDQREEFPDVSPIAIQALLVAGRNRRVKIPAGTPEKPLTNGDGGLKLEAL